MAIIVRCPNPQCGQTFHVPDSYAGKTGRCHACKASFPIPAAGSDASDQVVEKPKPVAGVPQTIGRFHLRAKLGAGAFGTVYRAHDPRLDREIALKVPQAAVLDSPKRVERFLREAKAAAALRHPNIVPVYDAGVADGQHFIASAFIEGQPLAKAVGEKGVVNSRAARIVRDLAEALAYAHSAGVVHRDVKPANVMLDGEDQPHLMDFGLAARLESTEKLTHEGAVLGTPSYMAPEQAKGQEGEARPESDQYALGVVLYELLTGRTPFEGPPQVVLFNVLNTEPPSPRTLRQDIPKDLETICLKAMAKDPARRYAGCQALADDLRRWLEGEPIKARRPSLGENLIRWFKQDPRLAGAIVTTVAALAVAAGALFWRVGQLVAAEARKDAERAAERAQDAEEIEKQRKAVEDALADGDQQRMRVAEQMADRNELGGIPAVLDGIDPARRGWEWRHLRLRGEGAAVKLLRGNHGLAAMTFDPASQVLLCATRQGVLRQWDVSSGRESRKQQINRFGWGNLTLSADGSRLVGVRTPPRLWYPINPLLALGATGLAAMPGAGPLQAAVNVAGGWRLPFPQFKEGKPNDVIVWDARTGAEVAKWQTSSGYQIHLAVDAPGKHVAIAVGDWNEASRLAVYDGDSGKVVTAFEAPFLAFGGVVLSPSGEQVVTLSGPEGKLRKAVVWETKTGKKAHILATGNESPRLVVFSPDGKKAATFCGGGMAVQKAVEKVVTTQVPVTKEIPLPDGNRQLVTVYETVQKKVMETYSEIVGGGAPTVRVHDAADGKELVAFSDGANVSAMAFSTDGSRLATTAGYGGCAAGNEVKLWDTRTGAKLMLLKSPAQGHLTLVAFSPDGQHVAAGPAGQDVVTLWSATDGRLLHTIDRRSGGVCAVGFSPDGRRLTTFSSCDQTARVYDLADRPRREVLTVAGAAIPLAFNREGTMLTSGHGGMGCYGGYTVGHGAPRAVGGCPGGCVTPGRFGIGTTGDGCLAKVLSPSLSAWQCEGMRRVAFPRDAGEVLAISPDGKRFIASSADAPARVWDGEAKKVLFDLTGVTGAVEVMFSPDGGLIAAFWSESETVTTMMKRSVPRPKGGKTENMVIDVPVKTRLVRNRLRVWDAVSGKERLTQDDATNGFAFSHDGRLLACATGPSRQWAPMIVLWDTRSGKVTQRLQTAGRQYCNVRFAPNGKSIVAFAAGRPPMFQDQTRTGTRTKTETRMVKKTVEKDGKKVEESVPEQVTVCVPYTYTVKVLVKSPSVLTAWSTVTGKELLSKSGAAELFAFSPDGSRLVTLTNPPAEQPAPPTGMPMPGPAVAPAAPPATAYLVDEEERYFVAAQVPNEAVPTPVPVPMPAPMMGQPPQPPKSRMRPVVQVWRLANGEEMVTFTGHATEVTALAYSPDGTRLVTADLGPGPEEKGDGTATTLVIWDAVAGVELARFAGHAARVNCAAWRPDGAAFATASDDGTAKVWNAPVIKRKQPRFVGTLGERNLRHWARVEAVAFSPNGQLVASASDDGEVKLHDVATGRTVGVPRGHNGGVRAIAWRPDGQRLASVSWDNTIKVWDATDLDEVRTIFLNQPNRHRGAAWCVAWNQASNRLVVGTHGSKTLSLWDAETGLLLRETPPQPGPMTSLTPHPAGTQLVSTAEGGAVKLWNSETLDEVRSFPGHKGHARCAAFSPDSKTLYTGSSAGELKAWEFETGKEKWSEDCRNGEVWGVAVSPDGATLAVGTQYNATPLQLRQAADGKLTKPLPGFLRTILAVAFEKHGARLVSGGVDGTVRLWDWAAGKELFPAAGHAGQVAQVAATPSGAVIVSAGHDSTIRVWDLASRQEKQRFTNHDSPIHAVAVSPGGHEVACGGDDGRVRFWSLATGKEVRALVEPGGGLVRALAFSADGKTVAASHDHNRVIRVWDLASGKVSRKLTGHTGEIPALAFTPEGDLVSGSHDGTVKVWDVAVGKEKRTLTRPQPGWAHVFGLALDTTGKRVAVAHNHGVVRVWDVASGKLIHEVTGLERHPHGVAFGKNGALAVTDHGGTLRLYGSETLTENARFRLGPQQGLIPCVCATPDGRFVVTGNADGTLSVIESP